MRVVEKSTKNKHFGNQEYFLFIHFSASLVLDLEISKCID